MPKENKHSRGRRDEKKEKKRKRDNGEDEPSKKRKSQDADPAPADVRLDNSEHIQNGEETAATERPFYGMLEDEEQEYFRRADELLELNDFPSEEEQSMFLANVYREAEGKELKIACSQSCSRLMERLILLSSPAQKKKLFGNFADNFSHLVQHRFASHCCEMLFIQSAPIVTQELTADSHPEVEDGDEKKDISMESLFLQTLDELEGNMTFLLTDRFASHTLRVLMVILSGRPLEKESTRSLLQSKRKEKTSVGNMDSTPTELSLNKRSVPESFQFAVEKIISDTVATMDTSFIRILATHPTGNPTLQLLLELELTNPTSKKGTEKTIISALLPDDITTEGSDSSVFINGILYDPIGSRLLETICTYAPGKLFKQIYRSTFKDRIAGLARNEISSYVVIRVLQRLSKEDLEEAVAQISPQILGLVQRSRTVIIKTLIERCYARGATKSLEVLTEAISAAYDSDPAALVLKMACIDDIEALIKSTTAPLHADDPTEEEAEPKKPTTASQPPKPTPQQTHGSLLAQTLLSTPGRPTTLLQNSLLAQSPAALLALSLYPPTSHIIQSALLPSSTNVTFRRKFLNLLIPSPPQTQDQNPSSSPDPIHTLALSPTGSHTLDSILKSTASSNALFNHTERIALSLTTHEHQLRESWTGRIVWRNWMLDIFKRKRGEWVNKIKVLGVESIPKEAAVPQEQAEEEKDEKGDGKGKRNKRGKFNKSDKNAQGKSAIQLAREKFAANKSGGAAKGAKGNGHGTGANQVQKIGA
ncbi:Nucleolar protein [Lachnellula willkommii]|uniref:Nucleolar protein 9 n=1 Tax=Lachnellula willkommii TaxID=215461 RepID=A0A559MBJ0_9HELO|nr:Nucleolar protein [Lachnellula willkommii]